MKKSVLIKPRVWKRLRALPKSERIECLLAIFDLLDQFGRPHAHHGVGIRKLTPADFEFRGNRSMRFVFRIEKDAFHINHLANHDEVRRLLRSGKLD